MFAYIKCLLNQCMVLPDANSRLVYLLQGAAVAVGILVISIAFCVTTADKQKIYPEMVLAVGAGTAGAAVGRGVVKLSGRLGTPDPPTPPAPSPGE